MKPQNESFGIYIHIPFCEKACYYCDFHFSTSLKHQEEVIGGIMQEIELRKNFFNTKTVSTIYFGGGTPSAIGHEKIEPLLNRMRNVFVIEPDAEITIEANPNDISKYQFEKFKALGINRLSIGIQSFDDSILKTLGRTHSAFQALEALERANRAGFKNLNIDLIFGVRGQSVTSFERDIERVKQYGVPHISAYILTIEAKTAFGKQTQQGKKFLQTDDEIQALYEVLCTRMNDFGFEHYEISNFALPGFHARHNSSYWSGKPYLGLGPSAHSFDGKSRYFNISNNYLYGKKVKANEHFDSETLTESQKFMEQVLLGLRTQKGLNLDHIPKNFKTPSFFEAVNRLQARKRLFQKGSTLCIPEKEWIRTDMIVGEII